MFRKLYIDYARLEKSIIMLIIAEFFLQLINTSFTLILNIFLMKLGYTDYQIADFVSYRFIGILCLALPMGLFIKGRKLKSFFYASSILLPITSLVILYAAENKLFPLLYASLTFWGIAFTFLQVTVLPYILRNAKEETYSEAISLSFATWSVGTIISGLVIYFLNGMNSVFFDEKTLLQMFSVCGFASIFFIFLMSNDEHTPVIETKRRDLSAFDWDVIIKALIPSLIIAVGAGLTIPFINLFFFSIFHLDSDKFSMMGSISAVLVSIGALFIPQIKKKYGYGVAIVMTQSIAIVALVLMAATEYFNNYSYALYFAVFFYLVRQPLMNMAGPITSELVMNYTGKRNHEMVSALTSAIWSGSWYISSRIFKTLRESGLNYAIIFFITAALYVVGIIYYQILIKNYRRVSEV